MSLVCEASIVTIPSWLPCLAKVDSEALLPHILHTLQLIDLLVHVIPYTPVIDGVQEIVHAEKFLFKP